MFGYYLSGRATLSPDSGNPNEIEDAVLAVWSQQWPRLRSSFSFCTALLNDKRRTEQNDYSVQVAPLNIPSSFGRERWLSFASADAALNRVTPLRRFLWRYGRDISASRRQYRMIIDIYMHSEGANVISADAAFNVFRALPDPSDGAVLKRDVLGIGPNPPRLVAAISAVDLLQLLSSEVLPEPPTATQVGRRLEELSSQEISTVARYYLAHQEALTQWKDEIYGAIIAQADRSSIVTYPNDIVADVLLARHDLIDADTLQLVTSNVLWSFINNDLPVSAARLVINEMLRRDMGDLENAVIDFCPELVFQSAVEACCGNRLNQSWLGRLFNHSGTILAASWLSRLRSTRGNCSGPNDPSLPAQSRYRQ